MPDPVRPTPGPPGWRGIWNARRARFWLMACALTAYLPLVGMPLRGWLDFSAFYAAGALLFGPDLTRIEPIVEFQQARDLPITPFVYPAGIALFYGPFAALPYHVAAALHVALMLAVLVVAARLGADPIGIPRRWAVLGALAWAPAAAGIVSGQNTSVALLLVALATAALIRGATPLAGALVGVLAYKPQLAPPLGGTLLLRGAWLAVALVAAVIAGQYLLGVVATGGHLGWPRDWLDTLAAYTTPDFRANGWQAISLPGLGRSLELKLGIPGLSLAGYVVGGLIVLASLPALRRWPPFDAIALACACGLVVSPHAWVYDATMLLPALAVLATRSQARGWPWRDRWLLATAFILAVTWPFGAFVGVNAVVVIVVGAPIALLRMPPVLADPPRAGQRRSDTQ